MATRESTTNLTDIEPISVKSVRGGPTWEIAQLFPIQGRWTESDYFALATKRPVELADGYLDFLPMPTYAHQMILVFLFDLLRAFLETADPAGFVLIAPLWVRLWPGTIREPDIVYMNSKHGSRIHQVWDGADLALEIVSPSNANEDRVTKKAEYARAGISEYWLVDPLERHIIVYVLDGKEYRTNGVYGAGAIAASVLLPGWTVALDEMLEIYDKAAVR